MFYVVTAVAFFLLGLVCMYKLMWHGFLQSSIRSMGICDNPRCRKVHIQWMFPGGSPANTAHVDERPPAEKMLDRPVEDP